MSMSWPGSSDAITAHPLPLFACVVLIHPALHLLVKDVASGDEFAGGGIAGVAGDTCGGLWSVMFAIRASGVLRVSPAMLSQGARHPWP